MNDRNEFSEIYLLADELSRDLDRAKRLEKKAARIKMETYDRWYAAHKDPDMGAVESHAAYFAYERACAVWQFASAMRQLARTQPVGAASVN